MATEESKTMQENSTEPKNTEAETSDVHLNLKVKSQDGNEVFFKVKKTTQLGKLMNAYCSRVGKDPSTVRFLFDGERIQPEATPEQLDMEDEDEIDAMVEQHGGFYW
jgi:small ubiquitin-related modifier